MFMEDIKWYLDMLELPQEATFSEVRNKYYHLKSFYSGDTLEIAALQGDFSEETRTRIMEEIEEAYRKLVCMFEDKSYDADTVSKPVLQCNAGIQEFIKGVESFNGPVLKDIRERFGIDLYYMAAVTNLRRQYLEDIEREHYPGFSAEVYLRGYVMEVARCLLLDPVRVADDYLKGYRAWKAAVGIKK